MKHVLNGLMVITMVILIYAFMREVIPNRNEKVEANVQTPIRTTVVRDTVEITRYEQVNIAE